MKKSVFGYLMAGALVLSLGACSKKKVTDEGDVAADTSAMQPTDVAASGLGAGTKIPELGTVYFAYDSFNLSGSSKSGLAAAAQWLKSHPEQSVQIEGHCDERGTTEYNLALGERRAGAVKDYLVSQGVSSTQLSTISYGEERPAVQGTGEDVWARNRRSEFVSAN